MKEREASRGTLLQAAVLTILLRQSFATTLKKLDRQADPSWDRLADKLARSVVESTAPQSASSS